MPSADSGHSTLRDNQDVDSEYEPNSVDEEPSYLPRARKRNRLLRSDVDIESEVRSPVLKSVWASNEDCGVRVGDDEDCEGQ